MRGGRNTGDRCASAGGDGACQMLVLTAVIRSKVGTYSWESVKSTAPADAVASVQCSGNWMIIKSLL
jgi:hypothetical protein